MSSISFDEIIENGRIGSLGSNTAKYEGSEYKLPIGGGYLFVTINYPRTDKFTRLTSDKQKKLYASIWREVQGTFDPAHVNFTDYTIELCDSGHCHLHGVIILKDECTFIPLGCVSDVVKRVLTQFPHVKGYDRYNDKSMYIGYCRYKSPGVCVQYKYRDDTKSFNEWYSYMYKEQSKSSTGKTNN